MVGWLAFRRKLGIWFALCRRQWNIRAYREPDRRRECRSPRRRGRHDTASHGGRHTVTRFHPATIRETKPHRVQIERRLTAEEVARIRALPWETGSGRALAREFGVSPTLVSNIRNGYCYKTPGPVKGYSVRITDGGERYSLAPFRTPEAAENARQQFARTVRWPRGAVYRQKNGRSRARLSLGIYDTRREAERSNERAITLLGRSDHV